MHVIKSPKTHVLFVDGLRAVSALYVVVHHIVLQYYNPDNINTLSGLKKISVMAFFQGHLAVDMFIVISGYSLMLPTIHSDYYLKKGTKNFFVRRAIRILPPYYFSLLASLLLIHFFIGNFTGTHWDISIPVTSGDILTHLLLIHDFFISHISKINHALWSVAVESHIYLLFPLLLWIWRKRGGGATLLTSIAFTFIAYLLLLVLKSYGSNDINTESTGVNPYIILFVLGMLAADISFSNKVAYLRLNKFPWLLITLISFILAFVFKVYTKIGIAHDSIFLLNLMDIIFGLFSFCLLLTCSHATSKHPIA